MAAKKRKNLKRLEKIRPKPLTKRVVKKTRKKVTRKVSKKVDKARSGRGQKTKAEMAQWIVQKCQTREKSALSSIEYPRPPQANGGGGI